MGTLNIDTETQVTDTLFNQLCTKEAKIAVVGLGKEGLETALHLATKYRVIGYDTNKDLATLVQQKKDPNKKMTSTDFIGKDFFATNITNLLEIPALYIITNTNTNKYLALNRATATVARHLKVGDVVIFQNTNNQKQEIEFYISLLERISGLQHHIDFKTAYTTNIISTITLNAHQETIKSDDTKTRDLVQTVLKNVTALKIIKTKQQIDPNIIANNIEKALKQQHPTKKSFSILLKGITSEKNTNNIKNSKAVALYMALYRKGINVKVQDNHILPSKVKSACGIELTTSTSQCFDAIVTSVAHDNYKTITPTNYNKNSTEQTLFFDQLGNRKEVKLIFDL